MNNLKTQTFKDVEATLWKAAYKFNSMYGDVVGTPEELFSEAYIAFEKAYDDYDPYYGAAFNTWIYHKVNGHLLSYCRKMTNMRQRFILEATFDARASHSTPDEREAIQTMLYDLPSDARVVALLVLQTPEDWQDAIHENLTRTGLRLILIDRLDWTDSRIRAAFQSLQTALA